MNHPSIEKILHLTACLIAQNYGFNDGFVMAPKDKLMRIPICSERLRECVSGGKYNPPLVDLPDYRMRLAFPYTRDSVMLAQQCQFEIYGVTYEPVLKPILLVNLRDDVAKALEAELSERYHQAYKTNLHCKL